MKPYYEREGVRLYHARAEEVLPEVNPACVIMDPPYGYRHKSGRKGAWQNYEIKGDDSLEARNAVAEWSEEIPTACFGSWKTPPPKEARTAIVWSKGPAIGMGNLKIPWKPSWELVWIWGEGWSGHRGEGVLSGHRVVTWSGKGQRKHPNEKPVSLLREILKKAPAGLVFDPFCGSGSVAVAASDLGRQSVSVDIDEAWCEVAARRIDEALDAKAGAA